MVSFALVSGKANRFQPLPARSPRLTDMTSSRADRTLRPGPPRRVRGRDDVAGAPRRAGERGERVSGTGRRYRHEHVPDDAVHDGGSRALHRRDGRSDSGGDGARRADGRARQLRRDPLADHPRDCAGERRACGDGRRRVCRRDGGGRGGCVQGGHEARGRDDPDGRSREIAEEARRCLDGGTVELVPLFESMVEAAHDSVARTPSLLPVLSEAGVVDAGALGLSDAAGGDAASPEGRAARRGGARCGRHRAGVARR